MCIYIIYIYNIYNIYIYIIYIIYIYNIIYMHISSPQAKFAEVFLGLEFGVPRLKQR